MAGAAVHLFHLARVRMVNGQLDEPLGSRLKKRLDRGLTRATLQQLEASSFHELKGQLEADPGMKFSSHSPRLP